MTARHIARHATHHLCHALVGVALFAAGRALTHRRCALWLGLAAAGVARLHHDHHHRSP